MWVCVCVHVCVCVCVCMYVCVCVAMFTGSIAHLSVSDCLGIDVDDMRPVTQVTMYEGRQNGMMEIRSQKCEAKTFELNNSETKTISR